MSQGIELEVQLEPLAYPLSSLEMVEEAMRRLIDTGDASLPQPGGGQTHQRWQALARVGAQDLSLGKLFESHADAQAILSELDAPFEPRQLLAVWAAEAPEARVQARHSRSGWKLNGRKAWCSGAAAVDAGLLTVWTDTDEPLLALMPVAQPGVSAEPGAWKTAALAAAGTASIRLLEADATVIGGAGDYLRRAGFWHGGAGVSALWYGAATALGDALRRSPRVQSDPFAAAHLGAVDLALRMARAILNESAAWIDAHPRANARGVALRCRAAVEGAALETMARLERALGPAPLSAQAAHAQRAADLRLFLRQSHAEADLAQLGALSAGEPETWNL